MLEEAPCLGVDLDFLRRHGKRQGAFPRAIARRFEGGIVAFPTLTLAGPAAHASEASALAAIREREAACGNAEPLVELRGQRLKRLGIIDQAFQQSYERMRRRRRGGVLGFVAGIAGVVCGHGARSVPHEIDLNR